MKGGDLTNEIPVNGEGCLAPSLPDWPEQMLRHNPGNQDQGPDLPLEGQGPHLAYLDLRPGLRVVAGRQAPAELQYLFYEVLNTGLI